MFVIHKSLKYLFKMIDTKYQIVNQDIICVFSIVLDEMLVQSDALFSFHYSPGYALLFCCVFY